MHDVEVAHPTAGSQQLPGAVEPAAIDACVVERGAHMHDLGVIPAAP